jgi:uncharacterized protein YgbK (DUF1537 family)
LQTERFCKSLSLGVGGVIAIKPKASLSHSLLIEPRLSDSPDRDTKTVVLADDLTGAIATGALIRNYGIRVQIQSSHRVSFETDVVIVNTSTRDNPPQMAASTLRSWISAIKGATNSPIRWIKRIDTTLNGPIREEMEVLLTMLQPSFGIACPAYPEADRITLGGYQYVQGVPVGNIRSLIEGLPTVDSIHIGNNFFGATGSWWIPDVRTHLDYSPIVEWLRTCDEKVVIVDSGQLTALFLARLFATPHRILVIQGSKQELTRKQVAHLLLTRQPFVDVIYQPISGPQDPALQRLTKMARDRLSHENYIGLIVGGGLTAQAILETLCDIDVDVLGSASPLTAISYVKGPRFAGLLVATKGGAVGEINALSQLVDCMLLLRRECVETSDCNNSR